MMDNAEEVMQMLEEFTKLKPQMIPRELDEYLGYVAKTGNPVFKWSLIKNLFREKMLSVISDFYEDTMTIDLPPCPNVDAFNYERMKSGLLERLDAFHGAPFTVQRLCELLTNPRKEYNRADKFMRAIEKNILVVSTREPERYSEIDCESTQECSVNGIQETNDLDASFACNDLDPVPVTSSHNLALVGTLNINNTSEPVPASLEGENEVTNDTEEISNGRCSDINDEQISGKLHSSNDEVGLCDEEQETSKVSSSNVSTPIDSSMPESVHSELAGNIPDAVISTSEDFSESLAVKSCAEENVEVSMELPKETTEAEPAVTQVVSESLPSIAIESETTDVVPTPSDDSSNAPECDQTDSNDEQFPKQEPTTSDSNTEVTQSTSDISPEVTQDLSITLQEELSPSCSEAESQLQRGECDTSKVEDETPEIADNSETSSDSSTNDVSSDSNDAQEAEPVAIPESTPLEHEAEVSTKSITDEQPLTMQLESTSDTAVTLPNCQSTEPMEVEEY